MVYCLYVVPDVDSDTLNTPLRFVRGTIDFSEYTEFKLHPIENVELPETEPDGSANYSALSSYTRANRDGWKMREGRVLYALAEYGDFFNCIMHYHKIGATGVAEWNTLFPMLQNSGYRKNIIPCMVGTLERL